jgi:multiple sugar transport system substrate-binding protein
MTKSFDPTLRIARPVISRRDFLKMTGAMGGALASSYVLAACGKKEEAETGGPAGEVTMNALYMNQAGYSDTVLLDIADRYTKQSGTPVKLNYTFVKYDELHDKIVTSAAAATATFDVILLDLIWTSEFGAKGYVIPLDDRIAAEMKNDIAPAIFSAFVYNGKTWAFPFLANFQCFFYNADQLDKAGYAAAPATLEEWYQQMVDLKSKGVVTYPYTDSWNQKEGLVCDYVRTAAQYNGDLFDESGKPIMDQGAGLQALQFMRRCIDEGLADPAATNTDEPGAMNAFVSGAVTFNTNWTFVRGNMLDPEVSQIVEHARVGLIPSAQGSPNPAGSVSGFQGLAVMANSKNPDTAWDFIKFATSPQIQGEHLESEFPVWTSVQKSEEILKINSDAPAYATNLANVRHRPRVPNYQQVSAIIQEEVHNCLLTLASPEDATGNMVKRISALG